MQENGPTLIDLYSCLIGSHAYGLSTPESDVDVRGVVMAEGLEYYFGTKVFETKKYPEEEDTVAWSPRFFMPLAAKGNTQMLEMLYAPNDCIKYVHPAFYALIIEQRERFMTKAIYNSILGYAYSEHLKAMGESSRDLGARRKDDLNIHGFSLRNATHCIRLMYAGAQAMTTGIFPVRLPEPERTICMNIKLGKTDQLTYVGLYHDYYEKLKQAGEASTLPEKFDHAWMNQTLVDLHKEILGDRGLL